MHNNNNATFIKVTNHVNDHSSLIVLSLRKQYSVIDAFCSVEKIKG
jgi:hypothetical protein